MDGPSVSVRRHRWSGWVYVHLEYVFLLCIVKTYMYMRAVYVRVSIARDRHSTTRAPIDDARARRATRRLETRERARVSLSSSLRADASFLAEERRREKNHAAPPGRARWRR